MDTLSDIPDTSYELPLSEPGQATLRPALLRDLGALPFIPGALQSQHLGGLHRRAGVWTRAVLPVDDSLGMPDAEDISGLCDLVGA
jgi:hypothetical protein